VTIVKTTKGVLVEANVFDDDVMPELQFHSCGELAAYIVKT